MEAPCVFFKNRQQVDKVCLMKGELPARTGEIAIDRMYADNNNLSVGDTLRSGKKNLENYRPGGTFRLQLPVSE